jgi:hypothetical protein
MAESRRLKGLQTLRSFGLPTPEWQEVRSPADIDRLKLGETPHGWTIRTCRTDGQREIGGFFMNNVQPADVSAVLRGRARKLEEGEFYIVYPSWKFDMSFNVVFDDSMFIVEGKSGSQKGISDGTELPEIAVRIPFGMHSRTVVHIGTYTPAVRSRISRVLSHLRRIPLPRYYTEVAITAEQQIFFYELFPIGV